MAQGQKSVSDLKIGEKGTVCCFRDEVMSLKLMEMGCLPGSEVTLAHTAPFGDPICIHVGGYSLSLSLREASTIVLTD